MRVAILSSGGKDSVYAHWWAILQGWDVISLITCKIQKDDSMMFQIPGTEIVKQQSKVTDTNYLEFILSGDSGVEIKELENSIKEHMSSSKILHEIEGLVTGALRSDYQKTRIEMMCDNLEIKSFAPLWHNNSNSHMSNLVEDGFEMMITSVSCDGLDESWIGKLIDRENLVKLSNISQKYRFSIDGEGGEFETSVVNAPHFKSKILIEGKKNWNKGRGYFQITSLKINN
ncbi:MAG TPA: diphthine--ammonia ligase [Candidatus Poseidoniaceae archaeon]|nr:diphthine--ammonia ligase [Candidatus Poseidoniaceae archaeon]